MIRIHKYYEQLYLMLNSAKEDLDVKCKMCWNTGFKAYLRPEVLK